MDSQCNPEGYVKDTHPSLQGLDVISFNVCDGKTYHLVSLEIVGFALVIIAIYVFKDKELNHSTVRIYIHIY